jgi:hypothetical protein
MGVFTQPPDKAPIRGTGPNGTYLHNASAAKSSDSEKLALAALFFGILLPSHCV